MKIERVTPFLVDRWLLVRVYTDGGIVGTGEAGLWAHQKIVHDAIVDLADYYVGKDPTRPEHHFQVVSRDTHFQGAVLSAAMSAIDIALWDILGKWLGQPVHQLLGGKVRDRVRTFANVVGDSLEERAASAEQAVAAGYTSLRAMPFFPGWETRTATSVIGDAVDIVRTIREAVGGEIDIGVEIHRNLRMGEAITLGRELQPFRLLYFEDPVAPESTESLRYIGNHVDIPIAAGERSYNLYQFKEVIDTGAVAMIRPDLSLAGGFTQVKKIAALAEAAFVGVFPHLMGSPINMAAYVQLDAAIPNYVLQENHVYPEWMDEIIDEPLRRDGGYVIVPDRPGIGLELREEKLAAFPHRPHRVSGWFREDGSVAH